VLVSLDSPRPERYCAVLWKGCGSSENDITTATQLTMLTLDQLAELDALLTKAAEAVGRTGASSAEDGGGGAGITVGSVSVRTQGIGVDLRTGSGVEIGVVDDADTDVFAPNHVAIITASPVELARLRELIGEAHRRMSDIK
jgi:hypothetical protein